MHDEVRFAESLDLYRFTTSGLRELDGATVTAPSTIAPSSAETAEYVGLRPSECIYELRGVLVHSGNARGGHYMSYIKPREGMRRLGFDALALPICDAFPRR